jgi:DNA-binding CsgD family transcriptional regulator
MSHDDLLPLIDTIYQAGLEPERWWEVLSRLVEKFNGTATLFIQEPKQNNAGFLGSVGMDRKFMRDYAQHFGALNPCLGLIRDALECEIIEHAAVVGEEEFLRTEYYNDFFRPMGVFHSMGMVVQRGGEASTMLAIQRARQAGPYSDAERRDLITLSRHMRRSIEISRRLIAAGWIREAASLPVKSAASGFVFVDAMGRVLLADDIAEKIFRDDNGLTVANGRLRATTADLTTRLGAMIKAATASGDPGGALGLPRRRQMAPLALFICPWHRDPVLFGVPGPAVLIFIEDPCLIPKASAAGSAALYNLTPAEARLLEALLNGRRLSQHAAAADIGITTARTHLRSIFAKTGQRRQADLVRLVLSSGVARQGSR